MGFKIISIIETGALLGIYTLTMCYVLYKVGWSLDKSAYLTILVFFVAELCSLILYIVNAFGDESTGGMPDLLAQSALYAVLLFYAYQMKVVKLKITCEDHTQFYKQLKRVQWVWGFFYFLLGLSLSLEINESTKINKANGETGF